MNCRRWTDDVADMGQRQGSSYRPESSVKQVGYLLVLAGVSAALMFAGLGLLEVILDSIQG